jgi:hypothetical protein
MAYLASTNSAFGARTTTVKPNPVQYCYMQTSDILPSGGNYNFLTKKLISFWTALAPMWSTTCLLPRHLLPLVG